jgi:hypothetical protein
MKLGLVTAEPFCLLILMTLSLHTLAYEGSAS